MRVQTEILDDGMALPEGLLSMEKYEELERSAKVHLRMQYDLCTRIERIADGLPRNVNSQECLVVSRQIYSIVKNAHRFEEARLFPLLAELEDEENMISKKLERLQFEHWEDESLAEDISEALRNYVSSPDQANSEILGYMLRGFFENLRRHLAFETEFLIPKLKPFAGLAG